MRMVFAIASLAALLAGAASANPDWNMDYDYPGQGADWYGARGTRSLSVDFAPHTDIPSQNGDDFGAGYNPRFDRFRQGPALDRTNAGLSAYSMAFGQSVSCAGLLASGCGEVVFEDGFEFKLKGSESRDRVTGSE